MNKFIRFSILCFTTVAATGCAVLISDRGTEGAEPLTSHAQAIATEVSTCLEFLGTPMFPPGQELESDSISLVSWNVKKGGRPSWRDDLTELALDRDLVLMQEAVLTADQNGTPAGMDHWSFAPGYRTAEFLTGVMTYSSATPLTQCNLTSREPWLGTPKATGITEYGLTGTDETLVVVNIHAINFTFGVAAFKAQLEQIGTILAAHEGPIIFSGDFNTWRNKRVQVLNAFVRDFDLMPVAFEADFRKTVFGQHLDHIYVRGLTVESSGSRIVETSDHNPLFVDLRL